MGGRTKLKRLSITGLTRAVAVAFSTPPSALVYWEENFDSYSEQTPLNGQAGPNGQVWELVWNAWADPKIGSLAAKSFGGQDGTLGVGPTTRPEEAQTKEAISKCERRLPAACFMSISTSISVQSAKVRRSGRSRTLLTA